MRWVKGMSIRGKMRGVSVKDAAAASPAVPKADRASARASSTLIKASVKPPKALVTSDSRHCGEISLIIITDLDSISRVLYTHSV